MAREKRKSFEKRERTICNVAPFVAFDFMSPLGYFKLPARPEGQRYGFCKVLDAIAKAPLGDDKFTEVKVDVDDLADSLINDNDAGKFGCFVAEAKEPTEEELVAAEKKYDEWRRGQVAEADLLWSQYHKHIFIGPHAKLACKELGLTREWMSTVSETRQCPNCAKPNILSQARCQCGAILDYERARDFGLLSDREEARAIAAGKLSDENAPPIHNTQTVEAALVTNETTDEEVTGTW